MDSIASAEDEVIYDYPSVFRIYKGGRVDRFLRSPFVPSSSGAGGDDNDNDGVTCVSKDVEISQEGGGGGGENRVFARLFLPKSVSKGEKLPVLIYIHGGAFVIGSAFSSVYNGFVSTVAAQSKVLAVSIEYRLAPENPIPVSFDDCWETVEWIASHSRDDTRRRLDPWILDHADFARIFVAGDSAGGTLAQNVMARASATTEDAAMINMVGMVLIHPYFGSGNREKLWEILCSYETGPDDPRMNPMANPNLLRELKCKKVLIFTAEKDFIKDRGWLYHDALKNSGWNGEIEIVESKGEEHVFHLINPNSENAIFLMKKMVSFLRD